MKSEYLLLVHFFDKEKYFKSLLLYRSSCIEIVVLIFIKESLMTTIVDQYCGENTEVIDHKIFRSKIMQF